MPALNWGMVSDGGAFESLMHAILYAEDPSTILFGRPGKDAGQDARSADGTVVYQAKYRQGLAMDGAMDRAMEELEKIKTYRRPAHANSEHWRNARSWVLVANISINPNDDTKWQAKVVPAFKNEGLRAEYWSIETLEGKLAERPEVRDVFFAGENRVLVGLKEAHDLLAAECVGGAFLDAPLLGRDREMGLIKAFAASGEKRILPVIGPGGIGKSRLLYESLVSLANDGWRVFWALPESMAKSSQWFRLLNGAQQTCVALDDPDDSGLLRAVVEQLATVERKNWRVLIAARTEKAEALRRYRNHGHVHEPVGLGPLDEPNSQQLVNACLAGHAPPPWLHSVYGFTNGVPGWLCLIAGLAKQNALAELPASADELADVYVNSCLSALGDAQRDQGRTLLRWLALWGTFALDAESQEQAEFRFLSTQGIPAQVIRDMLKHLVVTGIVRNWGVAKRLFAVEPLIIRQQILGSWLLLEERGRYEVGTDGSALVAQLVRGEVPAADSALQSLASLARMRLSDSEGTVFLGPVFRSMEGSARDGTLLDQYRMVELVEKVGAADPESALDLLRTIRTVAKDSMTVDVPIWGSQTYTHDALVAKLPWVLFELAQRVSDPNTGRRYLGEFGQYVTLEDQGSLEAGSGRKPGELLKRLLCGSGNSLIYAAPAYELVQSELCDPERWPFVGLLAECLVNPVRETTDWVARWTLSFGRRRIVAGSPEWKAMVKVRGLAFEALRAGTQPALCPSLWRMLSESHHALHREVLQESVKGAEAEAYHGVLVDDLTRCQDVLRDRGHALTVEEATAARQMWEWYLKHGKEDDLVPPARECERLYNARSEWRVHDFFRFETEEALAPETQRIFEAFRNATGPETLNGFFSEARDYLAAARGKSKDMADDWRITDLARACADLLDFNTLPPGNAVTAFVRSILPQQTPHRDNELAWGFTVMLCRKHLLTVKEQGAGMAKEGLGQLLEMTSAKGRLLWGIYGNVHPNTTGVLTDAELSILLAHEGEFSNYEWFVLLGAFHAVDGAGVREQLHARLDAMRENPVEASECMARFIRSVHITALRYKWTPDQLPVDWIIDQISELGLDGALLTLHDTEWLRDQARFRLDASGLLRIVESRIKMEVISSGAGRIESFPHRFSVRDWARFNANDTNDVRAFQELCGLALGPSFVGLHWIPKFLAALDPSGVQVAAFVESHLAAQPVLDANALARIAYLAAAYPDDTEAWRACAMPVAMRCQAMNLNREDRFHVFFGLSWKESITYSSMPGQVADIWTQKVDRARGLRDAEPSASPLRPYRDWVFLCAEHDLHREEGRAEEVANG